MKKNPKILFICEEIKHYTIPFFIRLHDLLADQGLKMQIVYGIPRESESRKRDSNDFESIAPSLAKKFSTFRILGGKLVYQPVLFRALSSDLVIVDQGNRHLVNFALMIASKLGLVKLAFWGHGKNLQAQRFGLSERIKKYTLAWCDRWFAYTEGTRRYLENSGVDPNVITVIQNSIDTESFRRDLDSISEAELDDFKKLHSIEDDAPIAIYCGSIYAEKDFPLLLAAAREIRRVLPRFRLLVAGAGPDEDRFQAETRDDEWIYWLGPLFGQRKAIAFKIAQGFLHPGALGLAALDSLTSGVPLITTENPRHGPEFEYLRNGHNALIFPYESTSYIRGCVEAFQNRDKLSSLRHVAREDASNYGTENMALRYRDGILATLKIPANRLV